MTLQGGLSEVVHHLLKCIHLLPHVIHPVLCISKTISNSISAPRGHLLPALKGFHFLPTSLLMVLGLVVKIFKLPFLMLMV